LYLHGEKNAQELVNVELDATSVASYDAVVILSDHDAIDHKALATQARLIVDTRNAVRSRGLSSKRLVLA
jgi:UDP-N-acetyl-D-glucosamine dehydrogenase